MQKSILLIDNQDSFTYNIWDYFGRIGAKVKVESLSDFDLSSLSDFQGIIIGPGPGNPTEMPKLQSLVQASIKTLPVLGICLGFQAIAIYFGASLKKTMPVHGKLSSVFIRNRNRLFNNIPDQFQVVRYHSLGISDLKEPLKSVLETSQNQIMAFEHLELPVFGIQYHPEAHLTEYGMAVFQNWLDLC